jgi:hypothetical protein
MVRKPDRRRGAAVHARLPPDLKADLDAFVEAHCHGIQQTTQLAVICAALRQFICDGLELADASFRERFKAAKQRGRRPAIEELSATEGLRLVPKGGQSSGV